MNLLMPIAGRGSRFSVQGIHAPKPLIDLGDRPFFWWAVESVRRSAVLDEMVFVVLKEHEIQFQISERIHQFYPDAKLVYLDDVTSGAAETASIGLDAFQVDRPVAINDCDHAFIAADLTGKESIATLLTFRSDHPTFSYVRLNDEQQVIGTVEKEVVSPFAIAGCYLFESAAIYQDQYQQYQKTCPYNELFISGIYNQLLADGKTVSMQVLNEHFPFGTPEEFAEIKHQMLERLQGWL